MAALAWLDEKNNTHFYEEKIELWEQFVKNKQYWNLQDSVIGFQQQMKSLSEFKEKLEYYS